MDDLTYSDVQTMINEIIWRETNKYVLGKTTIEETMEDIRLAQEKLLRGAKYQSPKVPSIKELI